MNSSNSNIGSYRLINTIYTGQASKMWQGYDDKNKRPVAIKVLFQSSAENPEQVNLFKYEYAVGSKYDDDKIIRFYEFGWNGKAPFIAMEWFPVPNVKQLMQQGYGKYCVYLPKLIPLMAQSLAVFNNGGYVHLDIKPDNFLYSPEQGIKLIDFAISKKQGGLFSKLFSSNGKGPLQGTASYMSPEQIQRKSPSGISDVYCLGCSFFEMLSGRLPYTGSSIQELFQKHISAPIPSLAARNSNVTPEFIDLLQRMMAKKSSDRIQSAEEAANLLRGIKIFKRPPVLNDEIH